MEIRARRPCYLQVDDKPFPDLSRLSEGTLAWTHAAQTFLLCPFTGASLWVAPAELALMGRLSGTDWTPAQKWIDEGLVTAEGLVSLVQRQVVVGDGPESQRLRDWEARLEAKGWHPLAALYHGQTRWSGVTSEPDMDRESLLGHLRDHVKVYGDPPGPFVRRSEAQAEVVLPAPGESAVSPVLRRRFTARAFLMDRDLPLDQFSSVLAEVFGRQGAEVGPDGMTFLKKTSPSGGSLHPVEAYPLVVRVEGLRTGIYHYRVEDHALELLEPLGVDQARSLITDATAGQRYFAEAHAVFVHVARFDRIYWKYRQHAKLYKAVLMDVAHLSQTLYLSAAARGLGVWLTAAINDGDLGARLGLDPLTEGALALSGLGLADLSQTQRHFRPEGRT
jgi:putative peptide maturation dehydrogenase